MDTTTRGALTAFKRLGVELGHDIMLASHLNRGSDALQDFESQMILVEFDPVGIVGEMYKLLEIMMDGRTPQSRLWLFFPVLSLHKIC